MHTASPIPRTAGSSETQSAALNAVMQQGSARVGQDAASLATLSDADLLEHESGWFHQFESATTKSQQHECVHQMARCIVEMSNRGMSLGGRR